MVQLSISTVPDVPMINPGDALAPIIVAAISAAQMALRDGDILVVAQKIVSKAEHRQISLSQVSPGQPAQELAATTEKDPRLVQLILDESSDVMRAKPGVIIVRHRLGHVGANAGIDQSNIDMSGGEAALLLPQDPDQSAALLREAIKSLVDVDIGVLVADSFNRPWRLGTTGGAIGCAGFKVLDDRRGGEDLYGRELKVTMINRADSIAAMATLAMGETTEKTPVAIVRGFPQDTEYGNAAEIMRPLEDDLFR